jgi:hypothetical protein
MVLLDDVPAAGTVVGVPAKVLPLIIHHVWNSRPIKTEAHGIHHCQSRRRWIITLDGPESIVKRHQSDVRRATSGYGILPS